MKKFLIFPMNLYISHELEEFAKNSEEDLSIEPPVPLIGKVAIYPPDVNSYYQAFSMHAAFENQDMPALDQTIVNTTEESFTLNCTFKEFEKKMTEWYAGIVE